VGKIFKPALRWQLIGEVYAAALAGLGEMVATVDVAAAEDKVHGTSVRISAVPAQGIHPQAIRDKIDELLARYTIRYTVDMAG
jgi:fatty-acyl-CoA synthase